MAFFVVCLLLRRTPGSSRHTTYHYPLIPVALSARTGISNRAIKDSHLRGSEREGGMPKKVDEPHAPRHFYGRKALFSFRHCRVSDPKDCVENTPLIPAEAGILKNVSRDPGLSLWSNRDDRSKALRQDAP